MSLTTAPDLTSALSHAGSFPAGFTWGVATSAYQVEGAVHADGRGESIWDRFSHTAGRTDGGDTGDVACDQYHRWREDIALMRDLGITAYRFSIAWPRLFPSGDGVLNHAGLDHYERVVDGLLAAGIEPWVTLYHWDLPQALQDRGGWTVRETAEAFARFAEVAADHLGDRVQHWITLNEPWCAAFLGHHSGEHAPGVTSPRAAIQASHTLLLAHGLAVPRIRAHCPGARVGISLNLVPAYPAAEGDDVLAATERFDGFFNRWFLDPLWGRGYPTDMLARYGDLAPCMESGDLESIAAPIDFLGVNYYAPGLVLVGSGPLTETRSIPPRDPARYVDRVSNCPEGLYDLVGRLERDYPGVPLVITENGAAYEDPEPVDGRVRDPLRSAYLAGHLDALRRAMLDGVRVEGYFAWSLLDNFEWALGYAKRFGLVHVDFATQRRTVKDSGRWYGAVARANRPLPPDDFEAAV